MGLTCQLGVRALAVLLACGMGAAANALPSCHTVSRRATRAAADTLLREGGLTEKQLANQAAAVPKLR